MARFLLIVALVLIRPISVNAGSTPDLAGVAYEQRLGARLPLHQAFRDDSGHRVRLSELLEGRPAIFVLGDFRCTRLCSVVRADLFEALDKSGLVAGRDYSLAAVSMDPMETAVDAATAKASDLRRFPAPNAERYWSFLTGDEEAVQALADSVGFKDRSNPQSGSFVHPIGVVFVTPAGLVSSYLLGVGRQPAEVRRAVTRAAIGGVGPPASPVMLLCYDYDAMEGRYTFAVVKLARWLTALSLLIGGGALMYGFRGGESRK
jgi:protein SCO1/2